MNSIKKYFIRQASRRPIDLTSDFLMVGLFFTCFYFGFVH